MKLEVGKTYKTRGGATVTIMGNDGQTYWWPFFGELDGSIQNWNEDGTWAIGRTAQQNDLIEEISPTPLTPS
jgi:hypothetical protein